MENSLNQRKLVTFSIQNILILLMVLFFGFTSLRFSVFGIGELILLFLCIVQITGQKDILVSLHNHVFSAFWLVYICIITIGYMINTFLNISPQSVLFDYGAYCVLLFLCFTFELLFKRTSIMNLYSLLRFIYFGGLLIIGILYLMFLRGNMYLFGYNLTYGGAEIFSPFANDYHQFAYFVAPLPFIGLFILKKERRMIYKLFAVLGIALSVKMGLATTSSTLVASWAMTTMIFFMLIIISKLKKYKKFISVSISFFCFITAAILISYEYIFTLINEFFSSDSNGENRFIIWQNAIKAWQFSPVFGLGPGSFSGSNVFGGYEAHNTFLQVLTQGGIAGGIAYILLVFKLTRSTFRNIFILCAICSLLVYGLGINDLRRTVLWFYYILFYFLCVKTKVDKIDRDEIAQCSPVKTNNGGGDVDEQKSVSNNGDL